MDRSAGVLDLFLFLLFRVSCLIICHIFLEAAKRPKTRPIVKKLPISPEVIRFASPNRTIK